MPQSPPTSFCTTNASPHSTRTIARQKILPSKMAASSAQLFAAADARGLAVRGSLVWVAIVLLFEGVIDENQSWNDARRCTAGQAALNRSVSATEPAVLDGFLANGASAEL